MIKCIIVVPCYNERERLDTMAFRAFAARNPAVSFLFVNDGSTDGTHELIDLLSREDGDHFQALHLERNAGKAEAVRQGVRHALRLEPSYVGYWDADLATPLEAIPEFVTHLDTHPGVEVLLGARVRLLGRQVERRPARHYLGRVFATVASAVLGLNVYDTQCGAKLFRVSRTTERLFEQPFASRWIFDVEILARYLHLHSAADPRMVGEMIHEFPLRCWKDIAGSKVRLGDFVKAFFELWAIHRAWLRKRVVSGPAGARHAEAVPGCPRPDPSLAEP
jgi:dolichyl-phosphate beta-glucosyltransferase